MQFVEIKLKQLSQLIHSVLSQPVQNQDERTDTLNKVILHTLQHQIGYDQTDAGMIVHGLALTTDQTEHDLYCQLLDYYHNSKQEILLLQDGQTLRTWDVNATPSLLQCETILEDLDAYSETRAHALQTDLILTGISADWLFRRSAGTVFKLIICLG